MTQLCYQTSYHLNGKTIQFKPDSQNLGCLIYGCQYELVLADFGDLFSQKM